MKSRSTRECSLTKRLEALHDEYGAILAAVEPLRAAVREQPSAPHVTEELQGLAGRIQQQAALLAGIRQDWVSGQGSHDPHLRSRIEATTRQLEQLIVFIQECERSLQTSRDDLRPQWDRASRHQEMQRAYGEHRRPLTRR